LEVSAEKRERTFIKLSLGILLALIAFIAVCWGGRRAYVRWQEKRLLNRAEIALKSGDGRDAGLAVRTVLQLKPHSVPASRLAAQMADLASDRAAIEWWRKVAAEQPGSVDDILAWARSALRFNDVPETERALKQLPTAGKETAEYHAVSALLQQELHHEKEAKDEWTEAVKRDTENADYLLQLGLLEIRSSDPTEHAKGVVSLQRLQHASRQRLAAMRALIQDGIEHRANAQELLAQAKRLQGYPEATLLDRLIYLDFLHQLDDSEFTAYLTELQKNVASHPADLTGLLTWLSRNSFNLLALDFIKTLNPQVLETWPVPMALADIQLHLKDWKQLEQLVKNANWRQFDFLRHAYLSRALREQDKTAASAHEWSLAAKAAGDSSDTTFQLFQVVEAWNWQPEAVGLLWDLSKYPDRQREAFTALYKYYIKGRGNTEGLYRVLVRLSELDPENPDIKNNLAQIALLLDVQTDDARRSAAQVYQKNPSNAAYATTYAYSLLTQGNKAKALEVMSKISPEQFKDPSISIYYGICLAAVRDPRGLTYLDVSATARLLPQEKALVEKARASLR
jgi:hypothetical protein